MLFLLRKLRRTLFETSRLRNYLLYATGEIVLVVIGILIALQINNWNAVRQKEASVVSYLNSIARNIREDLAESRTVRDARIQAAQDGLRVYMHFGKPEMADIAFASKAFEQATDLIYFNASQSGYEAFMNSGTLDYMQGRDIETLLYDYYDTVRSIRLLEENHNQLLKLYWERSLSEWPEGVQGWEFANPTVLSERRLAELQGLFREYLDSDGLLNLFVFAGDIQSLLLEYHRLEILGEAFIRTVEAGSMDFNGEVLALLETIHDPESGVGYPQVIRDGALFSANYNLLWADSTEWRIAGAAPDALSGPPDRSVFQINTFDRVGDAMHINYSGGADWAAVSITVPLTGDRRGGQDFSMYETLVLELKGDRGGESVIFNLKDSEDPDDGTQTNVELSLTDEWQTYEIDLDRFETADLSKLHVALGILFLKEPQGFSIRNAWYR